MSNIYKDYCYEVFNAEIKKENIDNASLNVVYNPMLKESGSLVPNINEGKYKITINLFKFKDMTHEDKLLYLKLPPDKINIGIKAKIMIGKRLNSNYRVSLNEINSLLVGYSKAINIDAFKNKNETIKEIIYALELLNETLEINYGKQEVALDNFGTYYLGTANYVKKYPKILDEYKVLKNFFNQDGSSKDIYTLYKERNNENYILYDKFITNLLISIVNYDIVIKIMEYDQQFREYIEYLIYGYIEKAIKFINNKDKCKIIIPSEEVINDNLIMIMKSITKINKLTNESKIKLKTPMVF